jgi:hypothetical protein
MNARNTPAQEKRRKQAAQVKFRRDLEDFKEFVTFNIRQLEKGRPVSMIVNVVTDPCGPKMMFCAQMIKGPPA